MYRCQLCGVVVPPGTPRRRVVVESRPVRYLKALHEQGKAWRIREGPEAAGSDGATFTLVRGRQVLHKRLVRAGSTWHTPGRREDKEFQVSGDTAFAIVAGHEIVREADACPRCAALDAGAAGRDGAPPIAT